MRVLDLFSGIGGFALGMERAGHEIAAFCEIEPFCQKVLRKHWPGVPIFDDIRTLNKDRLYDKGIETIDIITAGYPCQPFSIAGQQKGAADDRHLWPEVFRILQQTRPAFFIGENVANHVNLGLDAVLSDLEGEGYACRAFIIPACAVGAPHRRDRVWIIAYAVSERLCAARGKQPSKGAGRTGILEPYAPNADQNWRNVEPSVCRSRHGLPYRPHRIKGLGNAVVPDIPCILAKVLETSCF